MTRPRVLVVHNRYQLPGGEDAVVDAEIELLRSRGHDVEAYVRHNRDLQEMKPLKAVSETFWSRRTTRDMAGLIASFQPDVIHVHNTFALISSSVYWTASRANIPVVQTLHNFRLMCVQAMFLQGGRVCEDCLGRVPWRGVARKCYRGSGTHSAALATMLGVHRALGTYRDRVTRYIALNDFCREKFIAGGLPASRIAVKPNFVDIGQPRAGPRSGGLFVGRLSAEKGLDILRRALRELPGVTIDVIGAGPDLSRLGADPQLRMLGWLGPEQIYERMRRAAYLVMPSRWYENFPRTLVEAFANGLPVIASDLGALAELVDHGRTGLRFQAGSAQDLARQIAWAEVFPAKLRVMGSNARAEYEAKFTPDRNYEQLMAIYDDAIAETRLRAVV